MGESVGCSAVNPQVQQIFKPEIVGYMIFPVIQQIFKLEILMYKILSSWKSPGATDFQASKPRAELIFTL